MISHPRSPRRTYDGLPTASESQTMVLPRRCPSPRRSSALQQTESLRESAMLQNSLYTAGVFQSTCRTTRKKQAGTTHASSHPNRAARGASIYNVSRRGYDFSGWRIRGARSAYARYKSQLRQRDRRAEPPTTGTVRSTTQTPEHSCLAARHLALHLGCAPDIMPACSPANRQPAIPLPQCASTTGQSRLVDACV